MTYIPEELKKAAGSAKKDKSIEITPRTLLSWFGFYRRTTGKAWIVQEALKSLGLKTEPDFTEVWLDSDIYLVLDKTEIASVGDSGDGKPGNSETSANPEQASPEESPDPVQRIGRLKAASKKPVSVKRDASVSEAITLMLSHDYSQLPVMQSDRSVEGLISWKSIGSRVMLGQKCTVVRDCMDAPPPIVNGHESLLKAIHQIVENDLVLIQAPNKIIVGIVTASDISVAFYELGEPFFILNEIENHVRNLLLTAKFSNSELNAEKDPEDSGRKISGVADLTFGEYIRLLEKPKNWDRLKLSLDRANFIKELGRVREIRNDVMHFDPDPLDATALADLKRFLQFLQRIHDLRRTT